MVDEEVTYMGAILHGVVRRIFPLKAGEFTPDGAQKPVKYAYWPVAIQASDAEYVAKLPGDLRPDQLPALGEVVTLRIRVPEVNFNRSIKCDFLKNGAGLS